MAAGIHISISAEKVTEIAGLSITNSMITSLIVSAFLIVAAIFFYLTYKPSNRPTGFHNLVEMIVEMFYGLVHGVTQSEKRTTLFLPYIATFFLIICLNNWIGLLPGVGTIGFNEEVEATHETASLIPQTYAATEEHNIKEPAGFIDGHDEINIDEHSTPIDETHPEDSEHAAESHTVFVPYLRAGTADLNTTLALAIMSQIVAQGFGFYFLGFGYLSKFFNFSSPVMFFVGILELMGEFTKIISYAFRLFGNIFAGEVLLVVVTYLTKVVVPMPFYGLEIFVGAIQALVFSMLSLVFFNMATIGHSEEH